MRIDPKTMIEALRRVLKRLPYPVEIMLVCVRWSVAHTKCDLQRDDDPLPAGM